MLLPSPATAKRMSSRALFASKPSKWRGVRQRVFPMGLRVRCLGFLGLACVFGFGAWSGCSTPDRQDSEFHQAFALLPLSFEAEGIWFSNFRRALDVAGVSNPGSFEELMSLPEAEGEKYRKAPRVQPIPSEPPSRSHFQGQAGG